MTTPACRDCLLRSTLLGELSAVIDLRARDRSRLVQLLGREDLELIELLGGSRREALRRAHREGLLAPGCSQAAAVCVHHRLFPRRLHGPGGPRLLYTDGDGCLLHESDRRPAVALLGTQRPSDYGVEMAYALAHSLAHEGVLVVTVLADGVARAARSGAEHTGRGAVMLSGNGLAVPTAVDARPPAAGARPRGCVAAELPPGCPGRRWGGLAAERTAVELADVVVVVEAESEGELFAIEVARAKGGPVAAVPGRATAPLSQGPLELLRAGASLVRSGEDVLGLLGRPPGRSPRRGGDPGLSAPLARLLDRIGSGQETPDRLLSGTDASEVLLGLAQLELMGRVRRTRDGR
ncbi:MAG TPA: DNA-processing protein DprA, partial [Solirubrobacteraceae bacterium]|nr:DNA-processing protein DprA [Solirubrobacteraceae bacterium]